ncbi:hypothetical protein SY1_01030 [Fretibacterium fastidiosum]|uniref:Uncharacterized protein n=1 Tax=Fretibacterium fastidiosum TaxID=651822 RepID=A0AB94IV97_9BACT|nr:hypothetical protein SY1_01030 [Fretibacterium fastidiosum]
MNCDCYELLLRQGDCKSSLNKKTFLEIRKISQFAKIDRGKFRCKVIVHNNDRFVTQAAHADKMREQRA